MISVIATVADRLMDDAAMVTVAVCVPVRRLIDGSWMPTVNCPAPVPEPPVTCTHGWFAEAVHWGVPTPRTSTVTTCEKVVVYAAFGVKRRARKRREVGLATRPFTVSVAASDVTVPLRLVATSRNW